MTSENALCRKKGRAGGRQDVDILVSASSYHLSEGRYFEAPFILKKQKKNKKLILLMMLSASLSLIPAFKNQEIFTSFEKGNHVTELMRKDGTFSSNGLKVVHHAKALPELTLTSTEIQTLLFLASQQPKISKSELTQIWPEVVISRIQMRIALALATPQSEMILAEMQTDLARTSHRLNVATNMTIQTLPKSGMVLAEIQADLVRTSRRLNISLPQTVQIAFLPNFQKNIGDFPKNLALRVNKEHGENNNSELPAKLAQVKTSSVELGETKMALAFYLPEKGPLPQQKRQRRRLPVPEAIKHLVTNEQPDILALGYASTQTQETPFDGILTQTSKNNHGRFIPPINTKDHAWAANPLPPQVFTMKEQKCLAEAIYFEARGESLKGQAAVAQVVLNRVRNPAYPPNICGVVYQNVKWRNRCQFSFACDGRKRRITQPHHWKLAQDIAIAATAGQIWLSEVGSSTHYHATYVRPRWARSMIKLEKIGLHIFYRTKYGGWS